MNDKHVTIKCYRELLASFYNAATFLIKLDIGISKLLPLNHIIILK